MNPSALRAVVHCGLALALTAALLLPLVGCTSKKMAPASSSSSRSMY